MPEGAELTDPVPVPARVTLRMKLDDVGAVARTKLAVQVVDLALRKMLTVIPVPVQAPDHPANVEPDAGVAVRVTLEFLG